MCRVNNGDINGSGVRGTGINFDGGSNSYLCAGSGGTCSRNANLDVTGTSATLGVWVKPSSSQNAYATIYDGTSGSPNYTGINLVQNNTTTNQYGFTIGNGSAWYTAYSNVISGNQWHFLVGISASTSQSSGMRLQGSVSNLVHVSNLRVRESGCGYEWFIDNSLEEPIIRSWSITPKCLCGIGI